MKKVSVIGGIILALILFFGAKSSENIQKTTENAPKILKIGQIHLNIEVADTIEKRMLGLSGRDSLGESGGMLFVFEKEGYYSFWMKDMKFPIDIAWLDKDKKIIHTEDNISPETYPKSFNSPIPSLYVLEVPAGFLGKNNIQIGHFVDF